MNRFVRPIIAASILSVVGIVLGLFIRDQGKVWIDKQSAGIAFVRGGYRSWVIDYSYGQEMNPDGSLGKSYYHKPVFRHMDLRWLKSISITNSSHISFSITNTSGAKAIMTPPQWSFTNLVITNSTRVGQLLY